MADRVVRRMHEVNLSQDFDHAYLLPIADLHFGDEHTNLDKLFAYLKWVEETPNAFILLDGDLMNTAIASSVSDIYSETCNVNDQLERIVSIFTPYRERILGAVGGNHEHRIWRQTGFDLSLTMCNMLGIPHFQDEMWMKVTLGRHHRHTNTDRPVAYSIYMTHGFGGGRKMGGKVNNADALADMAGTDVVITAHTHSPFAYPRVRYFPNVQTASVIEQKQVVVSCGGYLEHGGYGIRKGFSPLKIGSPRIRLDGRRKDVHASI